MALITAAEAQTLWDNRTVSKKQYNSNDTQTAGTFIHYIFESQLDGYSYICNSDTEGVAITHSSSAATIETQVKAFLETCEKRVDPEYSETII